MAINRKNRIFLGTYCEGSKTLRRVLEITTRKNECRKTLDTRASVVSVDSEQPGWFTFMPFSDFNKLVEQNKARCTQKNIDEQHARGMTMAEDLKQAAMGHYNDWSNQA